MFPQRARRWSFALLLTLVVAGFVPSSRAAEDAPRSRLTVVRYAAPLAPAAAAKVDPRLLGALAYPRDTEEFLQGTATQIAIQGTSLEDLTFPVLVRSTLTDAELAALGAPPDTRVGDIVTTRVREDALARLASDPGVQAIEASYRLDPALNISVPEIRADRVNQAGTGFTGKNVLFGLMDDGIDITHDDFKDAQGSRILYIWDQYPHGQDPGTGGGTGFNYGWEYTKAQIDAGQAAEFTNPGGHGSHVAGIGVGNDTLYRGVAWEANVIAVRNGGCDIFCYGGGTPPFGDARTVGSIDGLSYMKNKADQLGRPLVVNQSQGVMMGPHDGTTIFETAYNNLINAQDLFVVVAAGNDQTAKWHGRQTISSGGQATFSITQQVDEQNPALQTLWFECWYDPGKQFSYTLTTPSNEPLPVPAQTTDQGVGGQSAHGDQIVAWSTTSHPANSEGYVWFQVLNQNGTEAGVWQLTVKSEGGSSGAVDLYCERNQYNFTIADAQVNETAIVGMPGTADEVITVASYNTRLNWESQGGHANDQSENPLGMISTFSSHGPRRDGVQKPDLSAPGAWIASTMSSTFDPPQPPILIATDGKHTFFSGTSMAAPHVAGTIALMLEKKPTLTHTEVKSILRNTARADGFTGTVPNPVYGYGKLDAEAAVNAVQEGGVTCLTTAGDANGSNTVNVLDVVAVVNHILGTSQLSEGGRACADVTGDQAIDVNDVTGIVAIIMNGAPPTPLAQLAGSGPEPAPVAWNQTADESALRLSLEGGRIGGLQMSFFLPRGYELDGEPVLHGADQGASLSWSENLRQYMLVAYNPNGSAFSKAGEAVTLEIPVKRSWDGGQEMSNFTVTRLLLSDASGRGLKLEREPRLEVPGERPGRAVPAFLERSTPNPMEKVTQIRYHIEQGGPLRVAVFDASGRRIRDLWSGWQAAGDHTLPWDGQDDHGTRVSDGVYFVRLFAAGGGDTQKILVTR